MYVYIYIYIISPRALPDELGLELVWEHTSLAMRPRGHGRGNRGEDDKHNNHTTNHDSSNHNNHNDSGAYGQVVKYRSGKRDPDRGTLNSVW